MTIYYSKNDVMLRSARASDWGLLARYMRAPDRAELEACKLTVCARTLENFALQSRWCAVLEGGGRVLAAGGIAPDTLLGGRARIWMLSARGVEKYPKAFFKISKAVVAQGLLRYPELYNFTDERYAAALRYVRRLGGSFDGTGVRFGPRRFLLFRFRRKVWEASSVRRGRLFPPPRDC